MTEKLKPEHRKLWRRIYFDEFEGHGATPEESEAMADKVVAQWEARGAFDEPEPTPSNSTAWAIVAKTLHAQFPDAFDYIYQELVAVEAQKRAEASAAT